MINILSSPKVIDPEIDTIILGAWGGGWFGCDNWVMCKYFIEAIEMCKWDKQYREIHFAIPSITGSDNDDTYYNILSEKYRDLAVVEDIMTVCPPKNWNANNFSVSAPKPPPGTHYKPLD